MVSTIIVAGGLGSRMGGSTPKQFLEINGEPILARTLRNFAYLSHEIIVVLPSASIDVWRQICVRCSISTPHIIVEGGSDRFSSVSRGLSAVSLSADVILVHDAVRPFAGSALIERVVSGVLSQGAVVPAIGLTDTIITLSGDVLDRSSLLAVQTPQGFRSSILRDSYSAAEVSGTPRSCYTDDASVVRAAGHPVGRVEGEIENIKITTPLDFKIAKILW